jgi:hypothetical protein
VSVPFDSRTTVRRALAFLGVYLALLLTWPLVRPLYAPAFRTGAEVAVGTADPFSGEIRVHVDPAVAEENEVLAEDVPGMDTVMRLEHLRLRGAEGLTGVSVFFHGWHPTAVLLALFLGATTLPWPRRRPRLLVALLLLHGFLALRLVTGAYWTFARSTIDGHPVREFSPLIGKLLYWFWHFVWEEPFATYLVPLLIWGVCVFGARMDGPAEPDGRGHAAA